jgi:hypothetical protein
MTMHEASLEAAVVAKRISERRTAERHTHSEKLLATDTDDDALDAGAKRGSHRLTYWSCALCLNLWLACVVCNE